MCFAFAFAFACDSSQVGDECASRRYFEAGETEPDQALLTAAAGKMPPLARVGVGAGGRLNSLSTH